LDNKWDISYHSDMLDILENKYNVNVDKAKLGYIELKGHIFMFYIILY